jgi:aminopeptidase YwaD
MQRIFITLTFIATIGLTYAQNWEYRIAKEAQRVEGVEQIISNLQNIGIRVTGSQAYDSATNWVAAKYEELGYTPVIDTFQYGSSNSYNVMIEKPGTTGDNWIIIGAHLDATSTSPGANDNGSGVAATLEIARIIKDIPCKVGVRIINFGAEEQGFYGSSHYVSNKLNSTDDVQLIINLDQLGGTKGLDNSKIKCERDEDNSPSSNNILSSLKTDTLGTLIDLYTDLIPVQSNAYASDYVPFQQAGYIITGLYQESDDPNYHSESDKVENMDIVATTEVIKGAVAAVLYFARLNTSAKVNGLYTEPIALYPNPAATWITVAGNDAELFTISISNTLGQQILSLKSITNEPIDVRLLPNGLYSVSIYGPSNDTIVQSKLIIAR